MADKTVVNGGKRKRGARAADVIPMTWCKTMAQVALAERRYSAALAISIGGALGLRAGDISRVLWSDLVDETGRAKEKVVVRERKNQRTRVVYPMKWAREIWEACYQALRPMDLAQPAVKMSRQRVWKIVKEMADECGYKGRISSHSLRKAFCSFLYDQTRDPVLCARLTGHTNPANLLSYIGRSAPVEENIWRKVATMEI